MKAKEFDIKKRDPNWRAMQDIRRSGAGGQHKDKKRAAKQGEVKHKSRMAEDADELYGLRIGDTVTAKIDGQRVQGDIIDIYPEDMEVELMLRGPEAGRTVTVDVRDTEIVEATGDEKFDTMMRTIKKGTKKQAAADRRERDAESRRRARDAFGPSPADKLSIRSDKGVAEGDEPDEQYLDKVISDLHKDAFGMRPDREFGREWMSSSYEEKLEIYNNMLKNLHSDMDEGIGGMIAGGVGQFIGNKIDPLAGEIMRAHGEIAGRKAEYTIRKYMHLLQKELKQQLDSGEKDESVREDSDWGEPREILEDVLRTLEREVEWPLTEVMDPKEVRQLLSPLVRAVNDKLLSMDRDGNQ